MLGVGRGVDEILGLGVVIWVCCSGVEAVGEEMLDCFDTKDEAIGEDCGEQLGVGIACDLVVALVGKFDKPPEVSG